MRDLYSPFELERLRELRGTAKDVEKRMPVKVTRHYYEQAKKSAPMCTLIKANPAETVDLGGAPDFGCQMDYSPEQA